jgi:SAM-dependent methyltransferase
MLTLGRLSFLRRGTYTDLASEYYDAARHPTCANFREASYHLLDQWLASFVRPDTKVLEVGAGASIVADWLSESQRTVARFFATDSSPDMLAYSRAPIATTYYVVCDARQLSFISGGFDIVVSSLGDPYNTPSFWEEAARVLRVGGHVLFTAPSFDWALKFRGATDTAEFVTSDGSEILVPSYVVPDHVQSQMIEAAGLVLVEGGTVEDTGLRATPRSPRLRPGGIVSGYLAEKLKSGPTR